MWLPTVEPELERNRNRWNGDDGDDDGAEDDDGGEDGEIRQSICSLSRPAGYLCNARLFTPTRA